MKSTRYNSLPSNTSSQKGFTLLETLIAIALLMLAIVGPLTIAQKSLKSSSYTKNRTVAYYLAQDAIEYLRQVRDTNAIAGGSFDNFRSQIISLCGVSCRVDSTKLISDRESVVKCTDDPGSVCQKIKEDDRVYQYTSGVTTLFRREVQVTQISTTELLVRVDVYWHQGILGVGEKKITLLDEIYDWQ